jgi:DNA mismatch endonuclease (patch repair protein)
MEKMVDRLTLSDRSRLMSRVSGKDTKPEIAVRQALHRAGFRFRLHRKDLPGTPDIVLPRYGIVVQIHGCFWHGHDCKRGRLPDSNSEFWRAKILRNRQRDEANEQALRERGWSVLSLWQCELKLGLSELLERLESAKNRLASG